VVGVGTTKVYVSLQAVTAVINQLMFCCWVSARVLDDRSIVSEKVPSKTWNSRLLRYPETQ